MELEIQHSSWSSAPPNAAGGFDSSSYKHVTPKGVKTVNAFFTVSPADGISEFSPSLFSDVTPIPGSSLLATVSTLPDRRRAANTKPLKRFEALPKGVITGLKLRCE